MDKKLFSIIFALASVMALVHFYSCTSAEDEFVVEVDSLAERRMTRSSMESSAGDDTGGDSGEDVEIDYPSADEILNAVSGEMSAAWSETP